MNLVLTKKRKVTRKVCGQDIAIVPYIDSKKKQYIIDKTLEYYKSSDTADGNYTKIICELRANFDTIVILSNTNVTISQDDTYDDMVASGLIDVVRGSIINYDEVYSDAMNIVSILKISEMIPTPDSIDGGLTKLVDLIDGMDDDQKKNFEIFTKAAMANSANASILKSVKGGN